MKNNLLIFFVFIFSFFSAYSQSGTITGSVQDDKSNENISDVKVLIQNLDIQSSSNSDGVFDFKNVPAGKQILLFSKYGYENKSFNVIVPDNGTVSIDKLKLKYKRQISTTIVETLSTPEVPPVSQGSQLVEEKEEEVAMEYVTKEEFTKAVDEIKSMIDEKMSKAELKEEVKEEVELSAEVAEPVVHNPEAKLDNNTWFNKSYPNTIQNRIYEKLNQ